MIRERVEPLDEHLLIEKARGGDRDAFGALVDRHQHEVFTLATRLVGDKTNAADVTQEAFVRAFRGIGAFRGQAAFSTWLHRITVNAAWTHLARSKRRSADPLVEASESPDPAITADPERAAENVYLRGRLAAAVATLPANQRAVVVLKDIYGWTHAEIAQELDISVAATKVRLHRAHQRLRTILKGEL